MTDPFAEVVALLQPSLPFSKATSGSGAWRVEARGDGVPFFCVLLEGSARLTINGQPELLLAENDFILVPAADAFVMTDSGAAAARRADAMRTTQLANEFRHGDPEQPPNMRALVGHLCFGSPDAHLLLALLPAIIHVRGLKRMATMVQLIRDEALEARPAREMIIEHLLQVLLIEALRSASDSLASPGLLRGLADCRLATAIRLMHHAPGRDWTIEQLANEAALSRSAFFDRFRKEVGLSPMAYLQSWRMALAKNLLRRQDGGIKEIAQRVGYGSASAFSTAFTRLVGMPPTQYARAVATPSA
ncbi:MAG: AraC family transcriptional regulator [Devosia sp.]